MTCIHLEGLLNQLEPDVVINQHLPSLKQALFHSHTKVVQVAVKQVQTAVPLVKLHYLKM